MSRPCNDLTGRKFGRLTAVARNGTRARYAVWRCSCECGGTIDVSSKHLTADKTRSCGCLHGEHSRKHGHAGAGYSDMSREYRTWLAIKNRCYSESNPRYQYYGGRGIVMCDEWLHDFAAFYAHVGAKPTPVHSIDREDSNGNYEPGNVRWATRKEQRANRRDSL